MTFDEVGAPGSISGGPSPATNISVVEPDDPQKRYEKNGRVTAIILVQKSSKSAQ